MLKNKKAMFKILAVAMMLVLSLTVLTGCGKKEETTTEGTTEQETKKEFSVGKWEENVYTSEFAELKYTLPEDWTRSTDEEIAQTMQLGEEVLADEGLYNSKASELQSVTDMMAKANTNEANVGIVFEKSQGTVDQYVDSLKASLTSVQTVNYTVDEVTETKIGENTYKLLSLTAEAYGNTMKQNYYVREESDYIVAIIVTISGETELNDVMKCFE